MKYCGWGCAGAVAVLLLIFFSTCISTVSSLNSSPTKNSTASSPAKPVDPKMAKIYARIGERPPSKVPIKSYLQTVARNPKSIELITTSTPVIAQYQGKHYWKVWAQYRGENGFGGMTIESGTAYIAKVGEHQQSVIYWKADQ
jgi:hypothetical protein